MEIILNQNKLEEEYLNTILSSIPTGIALLKGKEFLIEFVNPHFTELTGKSTIIGKPGRKALPEFSGIWDVIANVYESGKPFQITEYKVAISRLPNKSKEDYFNFNFIPLKISNRIEGVIIHLSQCTQQVLASKEAKENAARLNQLLEAIPQMAWTALPSGEVNYLNQRWSDYTGQSHNEALGYGWKDVIHPDDLVSSFEKWSESLSTGRILITQYRLKRIIDNQFRWHLNKAVPLRNENGEIILWVGTCTDVHDQVSDQLRLMDANTELKKINKDLDNFIYTASHDLKAPISNIEGLINLLTSDLNEKKIIDNDQKSILEMISFSINSFKDIVKDLSEISHTQKNIFKDVEAINIEDIIKEVIHSFNESIQECCAFIEVDFEPGLKLVYSRTCLKRILTNLLSNAIKFRNPEKRLRVIISSQKKDGFVIIKVKDNGLGIKKENKERIFEMFKRFHNNTEGSGIGLYLTKRMIENNEGKIAVETTENEGSEFAIYLKEITKDNIKK